MVVRGASRRQNRLQEFVDGLRPVSMKHPRRAVCKGSPMVADLAAMAKRSDWQSIERLLQTQPDCQTRDMLIECLAVEITGRPKWLDIWADQRPREYLPLLVRGYHAVSWAWEARGAKRAKQTGQNQFKLFFERLQVARVDLEEAARRSPDDDPGALAFQVTLARGLEYPKPDLLALYEKVQQRSPYHPVAVWSMVQGMAPKWSGSLDAMLGIAREAAAAPPG